MEQQDTAQETATQVVASLNDVDRWLLAAISNVYKRPCLSTNSRRLRGLSDDSVGPVQPQGPGGFVQDTLMATGTTTVIGSMSWWVSENSFINRASFPAMVPPAGVADAMSIRLGVLSFDITSSFLALSGELHTELDTQGLMY